jgi:hypothetical protein
MEQGHHTANEMTANLHAIRALPRTRLADRASKLARTDYTQFIRTLTGLIRLRFPNTVRTMVYGLHARMKLVSCAADRPRLSPAR